MEAIALRARIEQCIADLERLAAELLKVRAQATVETFRALARA